MKKEKKIRLKDGKKEKRNRKKLRRRIAIKISLCSTKEMGVASLNSFNFFSVLRCSYLLLIFYN